MRKIISLTLVMAIVTSLLIAPSFAGSNNQIPAGQHLVKTLVETINNQDWDDFSNCFITADKDSYSQFLNDKMNQDSHIGILNVSSAKLKEFMQLPEQACIGTTNVQNLKESYSDLKYYLVGIDCKVDTEDKYHYNGVNYRLIVTCTENGEEKIVEMSDAPIENFSEMGYSFKSNDEKKALKIIMRRYKGEIVNQDGKILDENKASKEELKREKESNQEYDTMVSTQMITATATNELARPASVRVYRTSTKTVDVVDYYSYVKNVLPNEWVKQTTYPEANKAGAMCVKMYAWFHVYHPKLSSKGADLADDTTGQVYKPGSELSYMTTAINNVGNIGIVNSSGTLFETSYRAGTVGSKGSGGTGIVLQNGTVYMAKQTTNNKYMDMMHYYYDNGTDQWHSTNIGIVKTFSY